jgi:DNA-binding transcriptional LysR family regulator
LAELEELLGARLFDRTTRRMSVTATGRSLAWHAGRILRDLAVAESDFVALTRGVTQSLHIGLLRGFSAQVLGSAVSLFQTRMPGVEIRFHEGLADELFHELSQNRVELVLSHADLPQRHPDVEVTRLYEERAVLITRQKHPLQSIRRVRLGKLGGHGWVLPPTGTTLRANLDKILPTQPGHSTSIVECVGLQFVVDIVQSTDLIAAVPGSSLDWIRGLTAEIQELRVVEPMPKWWVCAARQRSTTASVAELALLECLKDALTPLAQ